MDVADSAQPFTAEFQRDGREGYVTLNLRRLTPHVAKELLLRYADLNDPEVKQTLQCIEDLQKRNGSGPEGDPTAGKAKKPYEKPTANKLTAEQAKLKLLGLASEGHQGAKELLELMFPD